MKSNPLHADRNKIIEENKEYIYKIACSICKRKLDWNNDDELSIAIIAFNKACDSYNDDRGKFLSYAKVIIKNSLIDYFRRSKSSASLIFEKENKYDYLDNKNSILEFQNIKENNIRKEEILALSKELSKYKISFDELIKSCPSHIDTRNNLLNIAIKCTKDEDVVAYINNKRKIPIKQLAISTGYNRKFFDKWRKYILTLIIIFLSEEYPYIKSYFNIKVGDRNE